MSGERLTRKGLIERFATYGTPKSSWRIGGEFERAVVRSDGRPVGYDEPDGIRWILTELAAREGWETVYEEDRPIALTRAGASITLEPGGQVELSGAPHDRLEALGAEMRANREQLREITADKDLVWIACGLTPITPIDAIPWVPKGRYALMRQYLPKRGDLAHYMMKGTCSVQANYDYADERDCARKVRLCAGLSPLTTAMFANSPLLENRPTGFKTYRGHIWTRTDPDRTGFPPGLRADFGYERWVDYLLRTPMLFRKTDLGWMDAHGATFGHWLAEGIDGTFPTWADWELHQTSVFPEVRIKHTIEVRGADCVDPDMALAFCALFTGLLYCSTALDEALDLVKELEQHMGRNERFEVACKDGLAGMIGGRSLGDWASDLGDIADRGIANCLPEDRPKIDALLERIEEGRSPADDLLDAWTKDPSPEAVIAAVTY
jgi:glutamate--cysteine ligase